MSENDREVQERAARLDALLESLESADDSPAREVAIEAIQTLLDLYGDGLGRIMAIAGRRDDGLTQEIVDDPLASHLLMVHGLHPVDVESRVLDALESVRPYLESHGGGVEFLGVVDGVVRLRLKGTCETCPASTMTLKLAVEDAILKAAPEVLAVDAEGIEEQPVSGPVPSNGHGSGGAGKSPWTAIGDLSGIEPGTIRMIEIDGTPAIFLNVKETYYAYRSLCPNCGTGLERGALVDKHLACPSCGSQYDVRRAGRCLERPDVHLEPVPLIMDGDSAQVAVPAH